MEYTLCRPLSAIHHPDILTVESVASKGALLPSMVPLTWFFEEDFNAIRRMDTLHKLKLLAAVLPMPNKCIRISNTMVAVCTEAIIVQI